MERTVREKATEAEKRTLLVTLELENEERMGLIATVDIGGLQLWNGHGVHSYNYDEITDIRFVGAGAEESPEGLICDYLREMQGGGVIAKLKAEVAELTERLTVAEGIVEPAGMTIQEAPESLRQKLEHAMEHGYEVTVSGKSNFLITGKILRIGKYEAYGDRDCVDFLSGSCVYLDTIQHVQIAYTQPDETADAHIEANAIYDRLNEAMEAEKEVEVVFDTNYTKGTLTGKVKVLNREKATIGEIDVYFVDMKRVDTVSVNTTADPIEDEPHDIAKERLHVHWDGPNTLIRDADGLHLAKRINASAEMIALMAAAPELADKLRKVVNDSSAREASDATVEAVRYLQALAVPNVAPWFIAEDYEDE